MILRAGIERRRLWWLVAIFAAATTIFIALTIAVTSSSPLPADTSAFRIVRDLRAPWLDHFARVFTTIGLFAVVGPAILVAAMVIWRRQRTRACALAAGGLLTWVSVWITKALVGRHRPPASLVHTAGQSFPSGHAANSVGWLALAIAVAVLIPSRTGRIAVIATGLLLAALVGLSRIYLRAHYLSDVIAGEALATLMYSAAAIGALVWAARAPHGARAARA